MMSREMKFHWYLNEISLIFHLKKEKEISFTRCEEVFLFWQSSHTPGVERSLWKEKDFLSPGVRMSFYSGRAPTLSVRKSFYSRRVPTSGM